MAIEIPTREPRSFTAGETVKWSKSLTDYPASEGWTLKYFLRGTGDPFDITCTVDPDDGDGFLAEISAAQSATLEPIEYLLQGRVENAGGEKYVVYERSLSVRPNIEAATNDFDPRSVAKRIVDAIDALAEGKASRDQQSYKIADRELVRMTPKELTDWRTYYWNIYVRETRRGKMRNVNCEFG